MNRTLAWLFILTLLAAFLWHAAGGLTQSGAGAVAPSGDVNCDGKLDISDPVYMLRYLFSGGPAPGACQAGPVAASDVAFEPGASGLTATNVQDALVEVSAKYDTLDNASQSFDSRLHALEKETLEIELVDIPPGTFTMGNAGGGPHEWSEREGPLHQVTLTKGFKLGATEVTQAQFRDVMGWNPSLYAGCPECPVEAVNWFDTREFCRILTDVHRAAAKIPEGSFYRLPTEAEWEYACRAGTTTVFFFGDDDGCLATDTMAACALEDEYMWWGANSAQSALGPKPVKTKKPNPWGLYDMLGNVWEWCQDWYGPYAAGAATDPQGPANGSSKVLRGGGWSEPIGFSRSSGWRAENGPQSRSFAGFRVVLESP